MKYDPVLGYEDIEVGMPAIYRGSTCVVSEKGDSVLPSTDTEHIRLSEISKRGRREPTIHRRVVNKYLKKKANLFVDFTGSATDRATTDD